jgi:hypothetical protein
VYVVFLFYDLTDTILESASGLLQMDILPSNIPIPFSFSTMLLPPTTLDLTLAHHACSTLFMAPHIA